MHLQRAVRHGRHFQTRADAANELPLVTAGDDLAQIAQLLPPDCDSFSAADVLRLLLPQPEPATQAEKPPSFPLFTPAACAVAQVSA